MSAVDQNAPNIKTNYRCNVTNYPNAIASYILCSVAYLKYVFLSVCLLGLSVVANASFDLDIDDDGKTEALTDGLLVIRHLFGFSGDSLTANATGTDANRSNATSIEAHLVDNKSALDVDGDGSVEALTDGLLIIRELFGFSGDSLITGAVSNSGTRVTGDSVVDYLKTIKDTDNDGYLDFQDLPNGGSDSTENGPSGNGTTMGLYGTYYECAAEKCTLFEQLIRTLDEEESYPGVVTYDAWQFEQDSLPLNVAPYKYWREGLKYQDMDLLTGEEIELDETFTTGEVIVTGTDDSWVNEGWHGSKIYVGFQNVAAKTRFVGWRAVPSLHWANFRAIDSSIPINILDTAFHSQQKLGTTKLIVTSSIAYNPVYYASDDPDTPTVNYKQSLFSGVPIPDQLIPALQWADDPKQDDILFLQSHANDERVTYFGWPMTGDEGPAKVGWSPSSGTFAAGVLATKLALDQTIFVGPLYPQNENGEIFYDNNACSFCLEGLPRLDREYMVGGAVKPGSEYDEHTLYLMGADSCSNATPVLAAYAAKVRAAYPNATAAELKTLLMTEFSFPLEVFWSVYENADFENGIHQGKTRTARILDVKAINAL